jgi:hypothetical protein
MDLTKQSTEDLTCKVWNHVWDPDKGKVEEERWMLRWRVPCLRCGTVKTLVIRRNNGIHVKGMYSYKNHYRIAGCTYTKEARGELRLELFRRLFGD